MEKSKQNKIIYGILAVIIGVVFVGVATFIVMSNNKQTLDEASAPSSSVDGALVVGSGDTVVELYEDYQCHYCALFSEEISGDIIALAEDNQITLRFYPLAFLDSQSSGNMYSSRAANAVATVADMEPELVFEFSELLFANQPEPNTNGLTDEEIGDIAKTVGISEETISVFPELRFESWVDAVTDEAFAVAEIPGTPTIKVDGELFEGNWVEEPNSVVEFILAE